MLDFGSQSSIVPTISDEVTVSPLKKSLFFKVILKIGKCFCAIILPEEFAGSKVPGVSEPIRNSLRLYTADPPVAPRFWLTEVKVNNW